MASKYKLLKAFHPTAFKKGFFAVSFYKPKKPLTDANTKFFQLKAKNRTEAIKKARSRL